MTCTLADIRYQQVSLRYFVSNSIDNPVLCTWISVFEKRNIYSVKKKFPAFDESRMLSTAFPTAVTYP